MMTPMLLLSMLKQQSSLIMNVVGADTPESVPNPLVRFGSQEGNTVLRHAAA